MREKVKRYNFTVDDSGSVRGYKSEHGRRVKRVEYFRTPPTHPDVALVEALEESQSLLTSLLIEQRSEDEIEQQIIENRRVFNRASGEQDKRK